jgi:hypothetical protein
VEVAELEVAEVEELTPVEALGKLAVEAFPRINVNTLSGSNMICKARHNHPSNEEKCF